jgi:hypothetical protein
MAEPEDFGARDRPHISINSFREATQYAYPARAQQRKPLRENYAAHADVLLDQLTHALGALPALTADPRLRVEGLKPGTVVEVSTRPPDEGSRTKAAKVPTTLEFPAQDIVVLRTERRPDRTESALLFVPDDARTFLQGRITDYGRDPGNARRPDVDRFEVVETITAAPVRDRRFRPRNGERARRVRRASAGSSHRDSSRDRHDRALSGPRRGRTRPA